MKRLFIIILFLSLHMLSHAQKECHIRGEVRNRPYSKTLLIFPAGKDARHDGVEIKIIDGKFDYKFSFDYPEVYMAVFKDEVERGGYQSYEFLCDSCTIDFVLYSKDSISHNTSINNETITNINKYKTDLLKKTDKVKLQSQFLNLSQEEMFSPYINNLYNELSKENITEIQNDSLRRLIMAVNSKYNYEEYSEQAKALSIKIDCINYYLYDEMTKYEYEHPSIPLLYALVSDLRNYDSRSLRKITIEEYVKKLNDLYIPRFPNHPYIKRCKELIDLNNNLKVGSKYVDFTAPDLNGKMHTLSDLIKGKIAIVNLWGSWCGYCRIKGMSFIPLWEKYAGENFTIVGVAGEFKSDNAMRKAIEKDGYQWINLLELDGKANIWEKYGADGGGGKVILVDKDGTILKINPKAEEVEAILKSNQVKK